MTKLEAADILDPKTTRKALRPYVFDCDYRKAVMQKACAMGAEALREGGWICVKDRLPENEAPVLAYYGFERGARGDGDLGMMFMGTLAYFVFDKKPHWQHESEGLVVTYWMPLPEPPTKDEVKK